MKQSLHVAIVADPLGGFVGCLLGMGIALQGDSPPAVAAGLLLHAEALLWAASNGQPLAVVLPEAKRDHRDRFTAQVYPVGAAWVAEIEAFDLCCIGGTNEEALARIEVDLQALARAHADGELQLVPELAHPIELVDAQAARWTQLVGRPEALPGPSAPRPHSVGKPPALVGGSGA